MMTEPTTTTTERGSFAEIYAEVQQFYARHFQLLDSGQAEAWADTFTEDGYFAPETLPEPVRGREALAAGVAKSYAELEAAGEQRRHWHGMVAVDQAADGTLRVRCYALIFSTLAGGHPELRLTCLCEDVLVKVGGAWQVRSRHVTRDDLRRRP